VSFHENVLHGLISVPLSSVAPSNLHIVALIKMIVLHCSTYHCFLLLVCGRVVPGHRDGHGNTLFSTVWCVALRSLLRSDRHSFDCCYSLVLVHGVVVPCHLVILEDALLFHLASSASGSLLPSNIYSHLLLSSS
jgi:hypothetical protein